LDASGPPHSINEVKTARPAVDVPFSFRGKLGRYLGLHEHFAQGGNIAWSPGFARSASEQRFDCTEHFR
jgi:hypothetical protein